MDEVKERIARLIFKYLKKDLSSEEEQELNQWIASTETNRQLFEKLTDEESFHFNVKELHYYKTEAWSKVQAEIGETKVVRVYPATYLRWVAAAVVLFIAGALWFTVSTLKGTNSSRQTTAKNIDVAPPKNNKAVISLADGTKVYLDSVANGVLAQQNGVKLVKNENGEIVYQGRSLTADHSPLSYNTALNPRGSKVLPLVLNDGTKVWLNSESSLKYPAAFNGTTREVQITGEAYFEVKHNAKQPFKVHLPDGSVVEDIGTAFNINAYADEAGIKTTLIEGSVKVSNSGGTAIIKPGEQATLTLHHKPETTNQIDLDEVMAWKNGRFEFGGQTVDAVMRQISRWYDVDIVYEGEKPLANFRGTISRQENISEVLKMLALTKAVKFRIEGNRIVVSK